MFLREIFRQDFTLYHSSHQSHISYIIEIPKDVEAIHIDFQYEPILEENVSALKRALYKEGITKKEIDDDESFRNLLTVSVNDPKGFRGAHHYFKEHQLIFLKEKSSSLGFLDRPLIPGRYEIIISVHGLFSDFIKGHLKIEIATSETFKPQAKEILPSLSTKRMRKRRPRLNNVRFYKVETHTHTTHSDGRQTISELLQRAEIEEIEWLSLTDHNTTAGLNELSNLVEMSSLQIIPGMEYTTFYGHFLVHGPRPVLDYNWSQVGMKNIDEVLALLKTENINITIAHPYDAGNPYCTGCRWDYQLHSLEYIDGIEIWNSPNPLSSNANHFAYQRWLELLAEGHEIAATAGRDWHDDTSDELIAYSYILAPEQATIDDVLLAMNLGRSYITLGPIIYELTLNGRYYLGDRIQQENLFLKLSLDVDNFPANSELYVWNEHQLMLSVPLKKSQTIDIPFEQNRLLRFEIRDDRDELLTVTNPIYFNS